MPKDTSIKKVLVIGSGPIVIGQAADELAGHIAGQGEPAGAQAAKNRDALGRLLKV